MSEVTDESEYTVTYYLPHHCVYNPQNSTTKLRVVFNTSSPTDKGNSLNSLQYNGDVIQEAILP